jgi:DNA-binding MarR family transcriptional regulator
MGLERINAVAGTATARLNGKSTPAGKRELASYVGGAKYDYFEIPKRIFDDDRLEPVDIRVYGVLFDAERGGKARISLLHIGQRAGRGERAAERSIRRLESAGWLKRVEDANGRCRVYRLTPAIGEQGVNAKPPPSADRVAKKTPAIGDTEPLPSVTKTPAMDDQPPNRSLSSSLSYDDDDLKKTRETESRDALLEELRRRSNDEKTAEGMTAVFDSARDLNGEPLSPISCRLHFRHTIAKGIRDPLKFAVEQCVRGISPIYSAPTGAAT